MNNIDKVKLPSSGLVAKAPAEVDIRGMKGVEISTLFSSLSDAAVDKVIRAVTDPHLEPADLCDEDKMFILHKTRRLTFGDEVETTIKCPVCGKVHKYIINYEDLDSTMLEEETLEEEFTMPDGKVFKRGVPTKKLWDIIYRHKEKRNLPETYSFLLLQVAKTGSVDGKKPVVPELIEYLENLPGKELLKLVKFLDFKFGLDTTFKTECKSCHIEFTGGIGINADLFHEPNIAI